jgi:hypothetical protein
MQKGSNWMKAIRISNALLGWWQFNEHGGVYSPRLRQHQKRIAPGFDALSALFILWANYTPQPTKMNLPTA